MSTSTALLHHSCFLVYDLEKSAQKLADALSTTFHFWTIEPQTCTVRGKASPFSFRIALADMGDATIELLTPRTGYSVYYDHLREKGEGFHHCCLVYPTLAEMQKAKESYEARGFEMIQHAETPETFEFCYFDLTEAKLIMELLYLSGLPDPEQSLTPNSAAQPA